MNLGTVSLARRPSVELPLDLGVGLVTAAGGVWLVGATWNGPLETRAASTLLGAALVLLGAWWTAGGVRHAR